MSDLTTDLLLQLLKQRAVEPDFTEEDYVKLVTLFRNDNLNQFSLFIIERVLEKKDFSEGKDKVIPSLVAILADRTSNTEAKSLTDDGVCILANTLYSLLMLIDIEEVYRSNF